MNSVKTVAIICAILILTGTIFLEINYNLNGPTFNTIPAYIGNSLFILSIVFMLATIAFKKIKK